MIINDIYFDILMHLQASLYTEICKSNIKQRQSALIARPHCAEETSLKYYDNAN